MCRHLQLSSSGAGSKFARRSYIAVGALVITAACSGPTASNSTQGPVPGRSDQIPSTVPTQSTIDTSYFSSRRSIISRALNTWNDYNLNVKTASKPSVSVMQSILQQQQLIQSDYEQLPRRSEYSSGDGLCEAELAQATAIYRDALSNLQRGQTPPPANFDVFSRCSNWLSSP
jgi:hypothetical protein